LAIPVISEILHIITSVVSWFFSVMPVPLRVLFFLFFIMFLGGTIMSWTVGMLYSCDSEGVRVYDVGFFERRSIEGAIVDGYEECFGENETGVVSWFVDWLSPSPEIVIDCEQFVEVGALDLYDYYLSTHGEPVQTQYGVGLTCAESEEGFYPTLGFYGQDVLDKRIWIVAGVLMLLMPLAFYWYSIVLPKEGKNI
jgi:hypothetical protein